MDNDTDDNLNEDSEHVSNWTGDNYNEDSEDVDNWTGYNCDKTVKMWITTLMTTIKIVKTCTIVN